MSETKETTEKTTLHANVRKPLSLTRTVETGHVQQKVGQRRMKSVEVVKKKKRSLTGPAPEEAAPSSASRPVPKVARRPSAETPRAPAAAGGAVPRSLSEKEVEIRQQALEKERLRAQTEEARRQLDMGAQAHLQAAEDETSQLPEAEVEETSAILAEPSSEPAAPVEAAESSPPPLPQPIPDLRPEAAAGEARTKLGKVEPATESPPAAPPVRAKPRPDSAVGQPVLKQPVGMTQPVIVLRTDRPKPKPKPPEPVKKAEVEAPRRPGRPAASVTALAEEDEGRTKKKGQKAATRPVKAAGERLRGKLTITNAFDEQQRQRSLASLRRKQERAKRQALGLTQQREKIAREVVIPEVITIQELANRMTERAVDVIKLLMKQGALHKINDVIDADTAELLVHEFGHTARRVSEADVEEGFIGDKDAEETLEPRAPVVTIMGHVDHGKTSLLDAIRHANVAAGEAGGITQHIGAYQVVTPEGRPITFIDTPGHEAFTAMRARGAKVTDIVVLVVAADDGVMPQTVEAINHAKAAGVHLIVAINKIDKPNADASRVRTELLQHEVVVESMSGETLEVAVSALQRTNLDKLLEAIVLQAEILDLKANPKRSAEGYVIEAKLERGRGPVGTLLVQRGTLRVGDIVVAGMTWGRVRALIDDKGQNVKEAGPAVPAEVLGFDAAPEAGDQFAVVESEGRAREITGYRARKRRETLGPVGSTRTLEQMMQQLKEEGKKEFQLVVKGDVQGSVEAIAGALKKLGTEEVEARIVHSGVGGITESDVALASASQAVIVGFNVRANVQAKSAAERDGVEIRYYNIIYDLVNDVKSAMSGLLAPTIREVFLGNAEILEVFNISKVGKVAGCRVTEGRVERGARVRLIRDSVVMHEGTLSTLKRFKDEVKEVPAGQECGMAFANYQDIRQGDVIECFRVETVVRTL